MPATYCSTTKQLQAQFCRAFPVVTCDDCDWKPARGCSWCTSKQSCPYAIRKAQALEAPCAVLNTAYFLAEANHGGSFSDPDRLLVLDEADTLEAQLLDTVSVRVLE